MYALCDVVINMYWSQEDWSTLSEEDQKVSVKGKETKVNSWLAHLLQVESWIHIFGDFSNLKELHPVQVAKYAVAQGIWNEPDLISGFTNPEEKRENFIHFEIGMLEDEAA